MADEESLTDKSRLLFGAGFVFGVMFTLIVLAVVTVTVVSDIQQGVLVSEVIITLAAGILFAAIVGVALYLLAFPENRVELPVQTLLGDEDDEGDEEER